MNAAPLCLAALTLVGTAAYARPAAVVPEPDRAAHVRLFDLDLASADGRAVLEQRIRAAAQRLCSIDGDRTADFVLGGRSCYHAAVADGLRQMDNIVKRNGARASGH